MSIATDTKVTNLETAVKALQARIHALESRSPSDGEHFRRNNATRRAEGAELRGAIESILLAHPSYSAKQVLKVLASVNLGREILPSVRTVQWHLKSLRNTTVALRSVCVPIE